MIFSGSPGGTAGIVNVSLSNGGTVLKDIRAHVTKFTFHCCEEKHSGLQGSLSAMKTGKTMSGNLFLRRDEATSFMIVYNSSDGRAGLPVTGGLVV